MGVRDSRELRCKIGWAVRSLIGQRTHGRANGPKLMLTLQPVRCAHGSMQWACAGSPLWAGRNAAAASALGTVILSPFISHGVLAGPRTLCEGRVREHEEAGRIIA